jgi:hypothetical protein
VVLGVEGQQSVEDDVQLFGHTELLPTGDGHLLAIGRVGVAQTFLQVEALDLSGNLDFGSNASGLVCAEASGVSDDEAVGRLNLYLKFLSVYLFHASHLTEDHSVSVVEVMSLLLMQTHQSLLLLSDTSDVCSLALLSSCVEDAVTVTEVNESEAVETQVAGVDKAKVLLVDGFVEFD